MSACISITTIPDRIGKIGPSLESLVAQGLPVNLWAVSKIARSDTQLRGVPYFAGVEVNVVQDCGPITKLLPALKLGHDTILTADDDCIYGEGWAAGLLRASEKFPQAAFGYRGRILNGHGYAGSRLILRKVKRAVRVDIVTGVFGALYRREFFDAGIFTEWQTWPLNDDLLVAAHLKRRGVPLYVIPRRCKIVGLDYKAVTPLYALNTRKDGANERGLRVLGLENEQTS